MSVVNTDEAEFRLDDRSFWGGSRSEERNEAAKYQK